MATNGNWWRIRSFAALPNRPSWQPERRERSHFQWLVSSSNYDWISVICAWIQGFPVAQCAVDWIGRANSAVASAPKTTSLADCGRWPLSIMTRTQLLSFNLALLHGRQRNGNRAWSETVEMEFDGQVSSYWLARNEPVWPHATHVSHFQSFLERRSGSRRSNYLRIPLITIS